MSYKKWIIVAALLFTGGMLLGLMAPAGAVTDDTAGLGEIADFLESLSPSSLFLVILINNVFSLVISFATSPVFLIMPILALTVNGWLLAAVGAEIVRVESLSFLLAGILPHGILEIPALIIAQAAAMSFGATVVTAVFKRERRWNLGRSLILYNIYYPDCAAGFFSFFYPLTTAYPIKH